MTRFQSGQWKINKDNFRIHFNDSMSTRFNKSATSFFVSHLLEVMSYRERPWYSSYNIPKEFLKKSYVQKTFLNQVKHVRKVYREAYEPDRNKKREILQKLSENTRRDTVSEKMMVYVIF